MEKWFMGDDEVAGAIICILVIGGLVAAWYFWPKAEEVSMETATAFFQQVIKPSCSSPADIVTRPTGGETINWVITDIMSSRGKYRVMYKDVSVLAIVYRREIICVIYFYETIFCCLHCKSKPFFHSIQMQFAYIHIKIFKAGLSLALREIHLLLEKSEFNF